MSKILKNNTSGPAVDVVIADTGVTVPASGQYVIPPQDYLNWAASSDVIVEVGAANLIVNDGSSDLSVSDGIDVIKGIFPTTIEVNSPPAGFTIIEPETTKDAFDRKRISEVVTLMEMTFGEDPDYDRYLSKKEVGGGTVTEVSGTDPSLKLSVGTASGDKASLKTRRSVQYNKGHSQLIMITGKFSAGQTNQVQRYGYFNADYGLFFQKTGTTWQVVRRSSMSGSVVDDPISQSAWNVDRLDGTGIVNPSGLTLLDNKETVFNIDFGWLGALKARFYVSIGGKTIHVHTMEFSNTLTVPFMDSGMSPVCAEIENTGVTSVAADLRITCCTVKSEGSPIQLGRIRPMNSGATAIAIDNVEKVVAGIRMRSGFKNSSIKPLTFDLTPTSGTAFLFYQVIYNPTLTSPSWADQAGIAEGLTNNPAYTGGSVIASGFVSLGSGNNAGDALNAVVNSDIFLGSDVDGNTDALILVLRTTTGNGAVLFSTAYQEFL